MAVALRPPAMSMSQQADTPEQGETKAFIKTVLAETEDTWNGIFQANGQTYREPTLVFFTGAVNSACGQASAASGPFYCPGDQKVYLDTSFFDELVPALRRLGRFRGGLCRCPRGRPSRAEPARHAACGQRTPPGCQRGGLQRALRAHGASADCYAGIWGKYTQQKGLLEQGDLEEALNAATQIGDDTLQKRTQGYVVPESFKPWHLAAARHLVQARLRQRPAFRLRHVQ